MNLLLLLSALLSALTGVGAAVRRPDVVHSVAQIAAGSKLVRPASAKAMVRSIAVLPTLGVVAAEGMRRTFAIVPAIAPWATRRRE